MHWYQIVLAVAALATVFYANDTRATIWIGIASISFVASSVWWDMGFPQTAFFGAMTNIGVMLLLRWKARYNWEMLIWACFILMTIIDLLWIFKKIPSHYAFALSLELANYLVLLAVIAKATGERMKASGLDFRHYHLGWVGSVHSLLQRKRPPDPWWKKW